LFTASISLQFSCGSNELTGAVASANGLTKRRPALDLRTK
jgi:hypothetical protein